MSGGHFNYSQCRIHDIAMEIEDIIAKNNSSDKDAFGNDVGYHFTSETITKFKRAVECLKKAQIMAHRIDWLLSGDDGEETFHERWNEEC